LNHFIRQCIDEFNLRTQRKYNASRRQRFEDEKSSLLPLPKTPFEFAVWSKATVHADLHVQVQHNFYSVPYAYAAKQVDVRTTGESVEVYVNHLRIAVHPRARSRSSMAKGQHSTQDSHLPPQHQAMKSVTVQSLLSWASRTGVSTKKIFEALLLHSDHPYQFIRRCLGIRKYAERYGPSELERVSKIFVDKGCMYSKCKQYEYLLKHPNRTSAFNELLKEPVRQYNPNIRSQEYWVH
jgi:hypothetical protein